MKSAHTIFSVAAAALIIGGGLFYFGPPAFRGDATGVTSKSPVAFTVLEKNVYTPGTTLRANYRITNPDELRSLYEMVYGDQTHALPPVDFSKEEVLAIFDGSHSTQGYAVSVSRIEDREGKRIVSIVHTVPDATCSPAVGDSSPFVIVLTKKSTLPLDHERTIVPGATCK